MNQGVKDTGSVDKWVSYPGAWTCPPLGARRRSVQLHMEGLIRRVLLWYSASRVGVSLEIRLQTVLYIMVVRAAWLCVVHQGHGCDSAGRTSSTRESM